VSMYTGDGLLQHILGTNDMNMFLNKSTYKPVKIGVIIFTAFIFLSIILHTGAFLRFFGRALPPSYRNMGEVMMSIYKSCERNMNKFGYDWPEANVLVDDLENLSFSESQPYKEYGIYVLESKKIPHKILYSKIPFFNSGEIQRMEQNLESRSKIGSSLVVCCVKGLEKGPEGDYWLYDLDYYDEKGEVPIEIWKSWRVITKDKGIHDLTSDIPPIPGCFCDWESKELGKSNFYFPEKILPALHEVYPDVNVPKEQIIRIDVNGGVKLYHLAEQ